MDESCRLFSLGHFLRATIIDYHFEANTYLFYDELLLTKLPLFNTIKVSLFSVLTIVPILPIYFYLYK